MGSGVETSLDTARRSACATCLPASRAGGVTDGLGGLRPAVITGQHDGAQSPEAHPYLLNAIVLPVREDARAGGWMQSREGPAVTDDGQPLNRAEEDAELALERFRTVAQERFDYLEEVMPPLVIQSRGFRNDGGNHGAEDGGVGIERHSSSRYHGVAGGELRSPKSGSRGPAQTRAQTRGVPH